MGRLVGGGMIGFALAYPAHEALTLGQVATLFAFGLLLIFGPRFPQGLHTGRIGRVLQ